MPGINPIDRPQGFDVDVGPLFRTPDEVAQQVDDS
jgi:methylmalonyl-CoA mutase cobalamin-binding subunit